MKKHEWTSSLHEGSFSSFKETYFLERRFSPTLISRYFTIPNKCKNIWEHPWHFNSMSCLLLKKEKKKGVVHHWAKYLTLLVFRNSLEVVGEWHLSRVIVIRFQQCSQSTHIIIPHNPVDCIIQLFAIQLLRCFISCAFHTCLFISCRPNKVWTIVSAWGHLKVWVCCNRSQGKIYPQKYDFHMYAHKKWK